MKKLLTITATILSVVIIAALTISARPASAIPDNVMQIAKKSCVKCHTKPDGKSMAISKLNLGEWDKLSPEKQAAKAKKMCSMVTEDKMPPKKFRESNPGDVPTKEEATIICDWAQSLQSDKK